MSNNQVNYSIDKEPDICAEFIAEAIEANLKKDESIISWDNPFVVDSQKTNKKLPYEVWLDIGNRASVNLTNLFIPLTFTGWKR